QAVRGAVLPVTGCEKGGCRASSGRFPPPLLIRAREYSVVAETLTGRGRPVNFGGSARVHSCSLASRRSSTQSDEATLARRALGRDLRPPRPRRRDRRLWRGAGRGGARAARGARGTARFRIRYDLPLDAADPRWPALPRAVRLRAGARRPARAGDAHAHRTPPGTPTAEVA